MSWHITMQGSNAPGQIETPVAATREHIARMADAGHVIERAIFHDGTTGEETVVWPLPEPAVEEESTTKADETVTDGASPPANGDPDAGKGKDDVTGETKPDQT